MLFDIENRLDEWSRWSRTRPHPYRSCGSIEGHYRSPQHWDAVTWSPSATPVVWRAMQVEMAVVALPEPFKLVIVLIYLRRMPLAALPRFLRRWRAPHAGPSILAEGKRRVADTLTRGEWRERRMRVAAPAK